MRFSGTQIQPIAHPTTGNGVPANEGPKLKDFMPYYREQKYSAASHTHFNNMSSNQLLSTASIYSFILLFSIVKHTWARSIP